MAAPTDLSDDEFDELDSLLARTPHPLQPLDAVMLDGYLCGVLVQPRLIGTEEWLAPVFDLEGSPLPASADARWKARCESLIVRRHDALNRALVEEGLFDPLIPDIADAAADIPEDLRDLDPISIVLLPWVAGFDHAARHFPDLSDSADEATMAPLARIYRHLPAESDDERELAAMLDREQPLTTLDDAVEDLVLAVTDLADMTRDRRFRVEPVRRGAPKVGRNDACPCGSGRKFKYCHGAA